MFEDVPVHASKSRGATLGHQRNLSLDFRKLTPNGGGAPTNIYTHQRNRSLDSVLLQRIPEDVTPSGAAASPVTPVISPLLLPQATLPPAASDDSGIHAPAQEQEVVPYTTARSRESLDSGNPEDTESSESNNEAESCKQPENKDFTLRLFESNLFTASMAISYLYKSKEYGVRCYLANKLFSLDPTEVDFYLPQLATLFSEVAEISDVLKPYLVHRCKRSVQFSLKLAWLLAALGGDKNSRASKLREQIMNEELRMTAKHTRGHQRSQSDATGLRHGHNVTRHIGDLASGRAFDNGCVCSGACCCSAARLAPELHFIQALVAIGRRLASIADKEQRNVRLRAELATLDLNLPAKVWLPTFNKPHWLLRIPLHAAAALNSKDKAPYIVYAEAVEACDSLPPRALPPAPPQPPTVRHARSEEHLLPDWPQNIGGVGLCSDCDDAWSIHDETDRQSSVQSSDRASLASADSISLVLAAEVRRRLEESTSAQPNEFRHDPRDPSATALKETFGDKSERLRAASPYSNLPGWTLLPAIVKVGDDLRVELLAAQVLRCLEKIWQLERVPMKLRPYDIICFDATSGIIQPVINSVSLHQIKRQSGLSLRAWMELEHGGSNTEPFLRAQNNFVQSAAAYSLVAYLLQLKDRHNGNILLDSEGHLVHIDFGFIMSTSPRNLGFESSPFKLTVEMVEMMDGEESDMFAYFKILLLQGMIAARKHMDQLLNIVQIFRLSGQLACLRSNSALTAFESRFHCGKTEPQLRSLVDKLIHDSLHSLSTRLYDNYQYYTNGIR